MNTIPNIANVADLQRRYRSLVDKLKASGEPMVIVSNGEPDVILLDPAIYNAQVKRLIELEEEYMLKIKDEALAEYKSGKTIKLGKNQKLIDLLK